MSMFWDALVLLWIIVFGIGFCFVLAVEFEYSWVQRCNYQFNEFKSICCQKYSNLEACN